VALASRAVIAIRRDRWDAARTLLEQAASVIAAAHLQSYSHSALAHAVMARVARHFGDARAAREHIQAAERLLPLLTRALAPLAIQTRLELVRASVTLGDTGAARDRLAEVDELLRPGGDFGSLREETGELSATVQQIRASAAEAVKLTAAELRLLPLLATQLSSREIAERLFVSIHTVRAQVTAIYRKLGVSSRTQAIGKARDLGLIPS
jgi:LuxR family maltose regulon positive regulatory protein